MMRLRVHHLFCSALYEGKGYSEDFCRNMQEAVQWIWKEPEEDSVEQKIRVIELVSDPDDICSVCPNQTGKSCSLDDNRVVSKDIQLAKRLGIETNRAYPVSALLQQTAEHLSREIFETSCHSCEWYQMGLCRYEKLAGKYSDYSLKNADE